MAQMPQDCIGIPPPLAVALIVAGGVFSPRVATNLVRIGDYGARPPSEIGAVCAAPGDLLAATKVVEVHRIAVIEERRAVADGYRPQTIRTITITTDNRDESSAHLD